MSLVYKNRFIFNQRGGSLEIDNTTEQEKIKLSQRSGSNINLTNVVNSELATNNKQTNVVHDLFQTVGSDKTEFVGKTSTFRTGGNNYELKGFISQTQLDAFTEWKAAYSKIATLNSQFRILRGGGNNPSLGETELKGKRLVNPVIGTKVFTVENKFNGYIKVPIRKSDKDEVVSYETVPDRDKTLPANYKEINALHITKSAGLSGSKAPGVLEFGAEASAATEGGEWDVNTELTQLEDRLVDMQDELLPIEQQMGSGGDDIEIIKRNKFSQIGAEFNDFPSIKIDLKGRSQPFEMLVSDVGAYTNYDYVPHVEEVDNTSNFPCGNDDGIVGNRLSRTVGSGGIHLKTTGAMELGSTNLKIGSNKINIDASLGLHLGSESGIELQSLKTITLRTNRQVYVESSLGVKGDIVSGGGIYSEGEVYIHHITAPLEVHQTQDTIVTGKFATTTDRTLLIGEAHIGDRYYPVYAIKNDDVIVNYPHSHHHNGIPMRLTQSNSDVRKLADSEGINDHSKISQALPQIHERKAAISVI
jgi:hypothetical protein